MGFAIRRFWLHASLLCSLSPHHVCTCTYFQKIAISTSTIVVAAKIESKFEKVSYPGNPAVQSHEILCTMSKKTYIVEHLDPELGQWSELEYLAIAKETHASQGTFLLSSLPTAFNVPPALAQVPAFKAEHRGVEELYAADKSRVCLLDPAASSDLSPDDGDKFDVFLFGGILGMFCSFTYIYSPISVTSKTLPRRVPGPRIKTSVD